MLLIKKYQLSILTALILLTIQSFGQEIKATTDQKRPTYSIGTGLSFTYFDQNIGLTIDSLHIFHAKNRPFDNALLKIGMGMNYKFQTIGVGQQTTGFNFLASVGYLYLQNQQHPQSLLTQFGTGVSVDYTLVDTTSHAIGATLYIVLNKLIVGIGGGAVLSTTRQNTPFVSTSVSVFF